MGFNPVLKLALAVKVCKGTFQRPIYWNKSNEGKQFIGVESSLLFDLKVL